VGSTTEFDDFSFVAGETIHTTHGGNTQNIPIYVKRKESTSPRSFRVKVEGIGLEGKTVNKILTVSQSGYDLRAKTGLSSMGNIPQEAIYHHTFTSILIVGGYCSVLLNCRTAKRNCQVVFIL